MKLLLDTHIFLWFISGDRQLPAASIKRIRDPQNDVYLSVASFWEIVVKHQLGKLPLPQAPKVFVPQQRELHRIASLAIDEETGLRLPQLPPLHRDPFDRILGCQALQHDLTIATVDAAISSYPVATMF